MSHGRHRLKGFDYRANRWYFATIVTASRAPCLGSIDGLQFLASPVGAIVEEELALLPARRPELRLPVSVVMPNHVHLLVGLANEGNFDEEGRFGKVLPSSLGTVIGGFKSGVTRRAREEGVWSSTELWQRRYHDRVLRNLEEWEGVADYILWNRVNWHLDPLSGSREPTAAEVNAWKRSVGL